MPTTSFAPPGSSSRFAIVAVVTALVMSPNLGHGAVCGNGILEPGEQCEAPTQGCCDPTNCHFAPAGALCREGSGDICDPPEHCPGNADVCPTDVVNGSEVLCRPGSGDMCDPGEYCSGKPGKACQIDNVTEPGTVCRAGGPDLCDPAETCTGVPGETCPADDVAPTTTVCRTGSGDLCDPAETCTGIPLRGCPATDVVEPAGTVCRAGSGDSCDPAEVCSGRVGVPCPADVVTPVDTVCRAGSGDLCDPVERCTGVAGETCPADVVLPGTTVCRAGSGDFCDPDETCPGVAGQACPSDVVEPASAVCRSGSGDLCDPGETCTGVAGQSCPADTVASPSTVCRPGSGDLCDPDETCTGIAGQTCPANTVSPAGTTCRPGSGDVCDPGDECSGIAGDPCPGDDVQPSTTVCRPGSGDLCDPDERCPGVAGQPCPSDTIAPATTVCRAGSGDLCDPDEMCSGNAGEACPGDDVAGGGTPCRAGSGDACDTGDECTGIAGQACPVDGIAPASTVCRAGSGDACDPDEQCTGLPDQPCPSDVVAPGTQVCRTGSGDPTGSGVVCDPAETCPGVAGQTCPTDVVRAAGTVCRTGGSDLCDPAETCSGVSGEACPANSVEPTTTVCRPGSGDPNGSGYVCDPAERCPGTPGGSCPEDQFKPASQVCNPGSGAPSGGLVCDPNELCPGVAGGACPEDRILPVGTVCRPGTGWNPDTQICDASESCSGLPGAPCPVDIPPTTAEDALLVRPDRDTRIMQSHNSSNDGAAGLVWLKRSSHVRGLVGFDLSCQQGQTAGLSCALLEVSTYETTISGGPLSLSAHKLEVDFAEGDQAFNDFTFQGMQLGSFPGTTSGATWACRHDTDLASSGTNDCPPADLWQGGDVCGEGLCYQTPGSTAFVDDASQPTVSWEVTQDVVGASDIGWLLKVTFEDQQVGSMKFYQRDGARFMAEVDSFPGAAGHFDQAPRLLLIGSNLTSPQAVLRQPLSGAAISPAVVSIDQISATQGGVARWENKTTGDWGYFSTGSTYDWTTTVPLALGANDVEFTVFDACGTEGKSSVQIVHAIGEACGDSVLNDGEECDDGNLEDGDCCTSACTLVADGTSCEDGDPCSVGDSCAAGTCSAGASRPTACANDYVCYKSRTSKATPIFLPIASLEVEDPFGPASFDLKKLVAVCAPAAMGTHAIPDPGTYRVDYSGRDRSGRSLPSRVTTTDRFGTLELELRKTKGVLTVASFDQEGATVPPAGTAEDHHACYQVKDVFKRWPKKLGAPETDTLQYRNYQLKKPTRLCLASSVGGSVLTNPNAHLMCYQAKRAPGQAKHEKILGAHVADAFGDLQIDTTKERELCVRASVTY